MIVHENEPITLIGGAEITTQTLNRARALAPNVVAADGGADAALVNDLIPKAVIGDFDSLSDWARGQLPEDTLHPIPEQDSTDFDKCLRNIAAPLVIGIGFSGARLDHQLAAYNSLVRHPHRRCILLGREELVFLAPPELRLDLPEGCEMSLFPMGAVEGLSDGLKYPISGLNFAPDGRVGTSNHVTGPVSLSMTAPKMLVILPEAALEVAAAALLAARAGWPDA
ncbi:thiamine diphosphokinase [Roseovarius pacificus]|uniref:thiamine diphosphokinase n=1 Tax=Roseovarius pacificus TaxID=337701 RepID=UPI004039D207